MGCGGSKPKKKAPTSKDYAEAVKGSGGENLVSIKNPEMDKPITTVEKRARNQTNIEDFGSDSEEEKKEAPKPNNKPMNKGGPPAFAPPPAVSTAPPVPAGPSKAEMHAAQMAELKAK